MFAPALNGIEATDQDDADTWAVPDAPWLVDQLTEMAPEPPDAVPFSAIDVAVVVVAGGWIVTLRGAGAAVETGGAGAVETTGAYSCWPAAMSSGDKPETRR
jgi:hypothetical protein